MKSGKQNSKTLGHFFLFLYPSWIHSATWFCWFQWENYQGNFHKFYYIYLLSCHLEDHHMSNHWPLRHRIHSPGVSTNVLQTHYTLTFNWFLDCTATPHGYRCILSNSHTESTTTLYSIRTVLFLCLLCTIPLWCVCLLSVHIAFCLSNILSLLLFYLSVFLSNVFSRSVHLSFYLSNILSVCLSNVYCPFFYLTFCLLFYQTFSVFLST